MTRPRKHRTFALLAVAALLMLAAAGNVLAEGVHASSVQLYAGLPGLGGRLVDRANRRMPEAEGSPGAPGGRAVLSAAAGAGRRSGRGAPLRTPRWRSRRRTRAAQGARG